MFPLPYGDYLEAPPIISEDDAFILRARDGFKGEFPSKYRQIFKGDLSSSKKTFCDLLKRMTKAKGQQRKEKGIYDLIQLSSYDLHFNEA